LPRVSDFFVRSADAKGPARRVLNVGAITAHDMIYGYAPEIEAGGQDFYAHKTGFSRDSLLRALRAARCMRARSRRIRSKHGSSVPARIRAALTGLDCASCNGYAQRFLAKRQAHIGPQQGVFYNPELVALPLRSAVDWRLLTQHLIAEGG